MASIWDILYFNKYRYFLGDIRSHAMVYRFFYSCCCCNCCCCAREECKQHLFNFWRDSRLICIWPLHFMLFDLPRCMMMLVLGTGKGTWRVADM